MGDFWAESIRLASPATEHFLCLLGQGKCRLTRSFVEDNTDVVFVRPPYGKIILDDDDGGTENYRLIA